MKKLLVFFVAALLSVAFMGAVYAAEPQYPSEIDQDFAKAKNMTVEGAVVSHDVKCHCFVIKGPSGNVVLQDDYAEFKQEYNKAKGLKIGAAAKVTYKTVNYINYATKVEQK